MSDNRTFWRATPSDDDYMTLLLDALLWCEHMGDVGDVAVKIQKDSDLPVDLRPDMAENWFPDWTGPTSRTLEGDSPDG